MYWLCAGGELELQLQGIMALSGSRKLGMYFFSSIESVSPSLLLLTLSYLPLLKENIIDWFGEKQVNGYSVY